MTSLKLVALDAEDLQVLSAHVQDAVLKVGDIDYRPRESRLLLAMNRFVWEAPKKLMVPHNERRNCVLHFDRVQSVKTQAIARDKKEEVLSLLAIGFTETQAPGGTVELTFAGGATMRIEVECIEARLADLGGAWEASSRPRHDI
ncbi:DUF2948 family protein [Nitratireductor mangrovi]|uniref:DUF2948 family protein n=1 Tax=Nitratireductor mangrovi TaxID=2599600 RepID=A0A5B8L568_9HYPH|nr:DUF2948 family protein [Nitratireductor mangrovi]QDZ02949.1 DUF2948 family protein [Nitratireductor mangrovi]